MPLIMLMNIIISLRWAKYFLQTAHRSLTVIKWGTFPLVARRWCDVESMSMTLIQRRNNAVRPVGQFSTIIYLTAGPALLERWESVFTTSRHRFVLIR